MSYFIDLKCVAVQIESVFEVIVAQASDIYVTSSYWVKKQNLYVNTHLFHCNHQFTPVEGEVIQDAPCSKDHRSPDCNFDLVDILLPNEICMWLSVGGKHNICISSYLHISLQRKSFGYRQTSQSEVLWVRTWLSLYHRWRAKGH